MKRSTKVWGASLIALCISSFFAGYYVRDREAVPDGGALVPEGPARTTPKPPPENVPGWDWRSCGDHIVIQHRDIVEDGEPKTMITCSDQCKQTEQKYRMVFDCPVPKHTVYARALFSGVVLPGQFDAAPGLGVGYIRHRGAFGIGGEVGYGSGLLTTVKLFQMSAILQYTF